jgi:hypothetical protein
MTRETTRTRVLVTVMTYPLPSQSHQEVVCTAGITGDGEWVRLYPVDYRYQPKDRQFRKYQWIEVDLEPRGSGNDNRRESRKPDLNSICILGEPISAKDAWRERRKIIDKMPHRTVRQLQALYEEDQTSLGIVRPAKVHDLTISPADTEWKPEWKGLFEQVRLFGPQQKPLRKLPYTFRYVFECEDDDKPHEIMIEDWELGVLFLKEADKLGSDEAAAESVKTKFFGELCREDKDTRFFVGTHFPWNTWLVLGVFWPPKTAGEQLELL